MNFKGKISNMSLFYDIFNKNDMDSQVNFHYKLKLTMTVQVYQGKIKFSKNNFILILHQ